MENDPLSLSYLRAIATGRLGLGESIHQGWISVDVPAGNIATGHRVISVHDSERDAAGDVVRLRSKSLVLNVVNRVVLDVCVGRGHDRTSN